MTRAAVFLAFITVLLAGCTTPVVADRSGRLLAMAADEAAGISSTLDRFTRQLNIADTQLRTGRPADADKTLRLAHDTLAGVKDDTFDDLHRIAGWTSISELARVANDRDLAIDASDRALAALNSIAPESDRATYVLSLSGELAALRGPAAAIELLNSGGGWAAQIANVGTRRAALTAFAYRLLDYDAYDIARNTLRKDPDPAWRTDTFLALANYYSAGNYMNLRNGFLDESQVGRFEDSQNRGGGRGGAGGFAGAGAGRGAAPANLPATFGKDVSFEGNYKR